MNMPATPGNIIAAAVVMQVFLSLLHTSGAIWVRHRENQEFRFYENPPGTGRHAWMLHVFSLLCLILLVFSDQFSALWRPLSGDFDVSIVTWTLAILLVFLMNIALCAVLVHSTGGSYRSPFTPVYFILPSLAFFLREPPRRILIYTVLIIVAFSAGLERGKEKSGKVPPPQGAYWLVSVACLALSAFIGYLTRSR
jgi:hypothetical protein